MIRALIIILHATQNHRFTTSIFSKSQEKNANQKTSPQTSKRSDRPEIASSKKQERKRDSKRREQSPRKNGGEKLDFKPSREKTYKTLWKTNHMNLFDESRR